MGPPALERTLLALQEQRHILSPEALAAWGACGARGALRLASTPQPLPGLALGLAMTTALRLLPEPHDAP